MQNISRSSLASPGNVASTVGTDTAALVKWQLFPYFVVRTTGFPIEFVERLQTPGVLLLTRQLLEIQARQQELRRTAPKHHRPERQALANFKAGKPLPESLEGEHDWVYNWNTTAVEK